MNLLVDTHVLLWWLADSPRLSRSHRDAIGNPSNIAYVSAATIWEIEIKTALGKLVIDPGYRDVLTAEGFRQLPVSWAHGPVAAALPLVHGDPFDRMLIAQAVHEHLTIVTSDTNIMRYDVPVVS